MYLSKPSSEREPGNAAGNLAGNPVPARAGLRVRSSGVEPTGVFVVVEMMVLVIVTALAMVAIIVSSSGSDDAQLDGYRSAHVHVKDGDTRTDSGPAQRANAAVAAR